MKIKTLLTAACVAAMAVATAAGAADAKKFGADRHVARGIQCVMCHGSDMKNPQLPEEATCVQCHNKANLAEKTKNLKPSNPHAAPHNGDCTLCHMQHEAPVNYCAQCHQFDFKVP